MGDVQIAVMAASFAFSFPAKILAHLKNTLRPDETILQYSTVGMAETEKKRMQALLEQSKPIALIGICIRPDPATIAAYKAARVPIVLVDEEISGTSTVTTDNFIGGYMAGDYLIKKGRKKIAVVSGRTQVEGGYNAQQRLNGLQEALRANGLTLASGALIEVRDYSYFDGVKAMQKLLDDVRDIDAIFCAAGDECAAGLLKSARQRGIKVPSDIAIVGYDDMDIARISTPPLTTLRQPLKEMAEAVYKMAITDGLEILISPKKVSFKPELVIRESA